MAVKQAVLVDWKEFEFVRQHLRFIRESSDYGMTQNAERNSVEVIKSLSDIKGAADSIHAILFSGWIEN